jgi:two-component system response regulator DctR
MRQALDGVLEKPIEEGAFIDEVRRGLELCHSRRGAYDEQCDARTKIQEIGDSELEILRLLADGVPNKQIASHLSLSLRTVEKHRNYLFRKLGVASAAEATRIWVLANLDH